MKAIVLFSAVGAIALSVDPANAAGFEGATIQYQLRYPDLSGVQTTQTAVVGAGVEFNSFGYFTVDLSDSTFTVVDVYGGENTVAPFNGIVLSDVTDNLAALTGVTFTGGGFAGEQPTLTFDANNIYLNFAAIPQVTQPGTSYSYQVTFADAPSAAPELASWAMMLGGFGLIGAAMRARRKVAVSFG